jgi:hypothetical protein
MTTEAQLQQERIKQQEQDRRQLVLQSTREKRQRYKYNRGIGMSRKSAALAAGYSKRLAMRKHVDVPNVDFPALFEQAGMTNLKKVERCIEGMNACDKKVTRGGYEYIVPNWTVRHKFFETMLRLCGNLQPGQTNQTNVLVMGSLADRIKESRQRSEEQLRRDGIPQAQEDTGMDTGQAPGYDQGQNQGREQGQNQGQEQDQNRDQDRGQDRCRGQDRDRGQGEDIFQREQIRINRATQDDRGIIVDADWIEEQAKDNLPPEDRHKQNQPKDNEQGSDDL